MPLEAELVDSFVGFGSIAKEVLPKADAATTGVENKIPNRRVLVQAGTPVVCFAPESRHDGRA